MPSIDTLIRQNKRTTTILMVAVALVLCALASVIALLIVGLQTGGESPDAPYGGYQPPPLWQTVAVACTIALLIAAALVLFANFGGASAILAMSHAAEIQKRDDPQLYNVVEELTIASGMPLPKVYLIDDTALNAFATGRDPQHAVVAITKGLRQKLSRDELQGVMAHELSHVRNYDIRLAMFAAILVGLIVLLADILLRYLWWGGGRRRGSRDRGGGVQAILVIIALLLAILAPIFARLLQLAVSRQREYLADASAAEMTRYPQGLASALGKLESDTEILEAANRATAHLYIVNPFKPHEKRFKASSFGQTHPDIKDRIQRLLSIGQA